MTDLSRLFAEAQSSQIDWGGPLHSMVELPTSLTCMTVRFLRAKTCPTQGLRVKVRGGSIQVESTTSSDVVLWRDSAPDEVLIRVRWPARGSRALRVWNVWRAHGVTQAWIGNAGMRVASVSTAGYVLQCSDGWGAPDFTDLMVEIRTE